jgi:hypothetical protein
MKKNKHIETVVNKGKRINVLLIFLFLLPIVGSARWGRIEISQAMVPYTITSPGSYVVVDDLVGTNMANPVISIAVSFVTLDLAGHTLTQQANNHVISSTYDFITIKNGTVTLPGMYGNYGIYLNSNYNRIEDIRCIGFKGIGIYSDKGSIIKNCMALSGGDSVALYGINAGSGSSVLNCKVADFRGGLIAPAGINSGSGCMIADSAVSSVLSTSSPISGIKTADGSLLTGCIISDVHGAGITYGVDAGDGCIINECSISDVVIPGSNNAACLHAGNGVLVNECMINAENNGIWLGNSGLAVGNSVRNGDGIGIKMGKGSLAHLNTLNECKIKTGDSSMIVENKLWNRSSTSSVNLIEIDNYSYVLKNYLWGWADGVKINGDFSRVDRNYISCSPEINAIGISNLVVRNRSNSWQASGTNDDFCATTITGSADMNDDEPWANVDF